MKSSKSVPNLMFTHDLVIFSETNVDQVKLVLSCIEKLCSSSWQKVNCSKSRIFFSKYTSRAVKGADGYLTNIPFIERSKKVFGIQFCSLMVEGIPMAIYS